LPLTLHLSLGQHRSNTNRRNWEFKRLWAAGIIKHGQFYDKTDLLV